MEQMVSRRLWERPLPNRAGQGPPFYGLGDLEGTQSGVKIPANKGFLKQEDHVPERNGNANPAYLGFPYYDPDSYGSGDPYEQTNHPWLFNPFFPADKWWKPGDTTQPTGIPPADDKVFSAYQFEALYRYGGTGSPAHGASDLFRLSPSNFNDSVGDPNRSPPSYDQSARLGLRPSRARAMDLHSSASRALRACRRRYLSEGWGFPFPNLHSQFPAIRADSVSAIRA